MWENIGDQSPRLEHPRRGLFGVSAITTLLIGVSLAIMVIFHFRAPPPKVINHPPEIRIVERPVRQVVKVPEPPSPSPPLPAPSAASIPVAVPEPPPPRPPAPPPEISLAGFMWEGVWRRKGYPLPMFKIAQTGAKVAGTCAPNWNTILPICNVEVLSNSLEFVADDNVFRSHFRMTKTGENQAKIEVWVTDEDWLLGLERANRRTRTPEEALLARAILEENASKLRKARVVGIFTRQPSPHGR